MNSVDEYFLTDNVRICNDKMEFRSNETDENRC